MNEHTAFLFGVEPGFWVHCVNCCKCEMPSQERINISFEHRTCEMFNEEQIFFLNIQGRWDW